MSPVIMWEDERRGRDRADKPEYKVKLSLRVHLFQHRKPHRILP